VIRCATLASLTALSFMVAPSKLSADEKQAIQAVEKLGGKVERADDRANKPIVRLDFTSKKVKDADLAVLKEFKDLENVQLAYTPIGDAGLEYMKEVPNLRILVLIETKVTDKGLQQLKGLKKLETLNVHDTKVTKKGIEELKKTLPKLDVIP